MSRRATPEPKPEPTTGNHCHRCLLAVERTTQQEDGSELCDECVSEHENWKW